jgi:hypothetical protein
MTHPTNGIAPARALALAVALAWGVAPSAAVEPEARIGAALEEQLAADAAGVASQQRVDQLSDETRDALLQYRQYLTEAQTLREYTEQLAAQVESQRGEIDFVHEQLVEIEDTARVVLPLMQKMVDRLERFVALDLPFQLEERRKRVAGLKETLGRADVTISEKYRRIVEAYQIEIEYGRTLEAYQGGLGEAEGARSVRFLRIGRIALLYQTLDGKETGYWDARQGKWVEDGSYRSAVKHGFAVADKVGAPDLLTAPVPAPVESRS